MNLIDRIRDALDMEEGETLVVRTPQFERHDGIEPGQPPLTPTAMDEIKKLDESELKELGLRKWSDDTGLWLLPHEWHPHIPADYPLLDILGEEETRANMPANPDKRAGMLAVGIVPEFEEDNE